LDEKSVLTPLIVTPLIVQYLALGSTPIARCNAYLALFKDTISEDRLAEIRAYIQQQRALGTPRFQAVIEAELARIASVRPRGRPRKVF